LAPWDVFLLDSFELESSSSDSFELDSSLLDSFELDSSLLDSSLLDLFISQLYIELL